MRVPWRVVVSLNENEREAILSAIENYGCIHSADGPVTVHGRCSACYTIATQVYKEVEAILSSRMDKYLNDRERVEGSTLEFTKHPDPTCDDDLREPLRTSHPSTPPVSADHVREGYGNLVDSINLVNRYLHPNQRFMVPFGVQEALVTYIEEREAIQSITDQAAASNTLKGDW